MKLPKYMRAFDWAWNAGFKAGYKVGKFEARSKK